MPRDQDLQWLELTDFSPGIFSNNNLAGGVDITSTNIAMASETNTYRCIALPTGGLGPLPRRTGSYGLTTIPDSAYSPPVTYNVAGFNTWGRVVPTPSSNLGSLRLEAHVIFYYEYDDGSNYDADIYWVRERLFNTTPSTETIHTEALTGVASSSARYGWLMKTRMNPTTPTDPGVPVMVGMCTRVSGNDIIFSRAWPDPAAPTTNATVIVGAAAEDNAYIVAAAHQGRIVMGRYLNYDHGTNATLVTNENVYWTAVNDNTLSSTTAAQLVPEIDQTISDMNAMSANQLFVVKALGGGYVIQGDLDDPTIVQLPNLPCPDGTDAVKGAHTSLGYVYSAGAGGMYLWNGGDGAELISGQLDGKFAVGDSNFISGPNGQCDRWVDRVLVPRNWIYDTNMKSWWRIDNISDVDIRFWSASAQSGQAMGAAKTFTVAAPTFMYAFDYDDLAYTWSWQSHPLWIGQATESPRRVETRQGIVAVQGHGTITVTVSDSTGVNASSSETITIDQDYISNVRFDIACQAQSITIRFQASGDDGGGAGTYEAPLLHRAWFGYTATQHLANSNN